MIVRDSPSAIRLFFIMQGSVVPHIAGKIGFVFALTLTVTLADTLVGPLPRVSLEAMGVFGVALSLFLGFRNNAAYARWWEARTLWGGLIADIRNLARQFELFDVPLVSRTALLHLAVAFAHVHRGSLRKCEVQAEVSGWVGQDKAQAFLSCANPADAVLREIAKHLAELRSQGTLDGFAQITLSETLSRIARSQAGCERIVTTPLPFVYSLLVRRTTYLYCILIPFALLGSVDWFAPVFAMVVAYVFFGLQTVTNELEHPFGSSLNGLPLDAMCRVIERSLCEAMNQTVPPELKEEAFILT